MTKPKISENEVNTICSSTHTNESSIMGYNLPDMNHQIRRNRYSLSIHIPANKNVHTYKKHGI